MPSPFPDNSHFLSLKGDIMELAILAAVLLLMTIFASYLLLRRPDELELARQRERAMEAMERWTA